MQLNSIDNMRVDGRFEFSNRDVPEGQAPDIPEGQAAVADLLAECFKLSYELRVEAETRAEQAEVAGDAVQTGVEG